MLYGGLFSRRLARRTSSIGARRSTSCPSRWRRRYVRRPRARSRCPTSTARNSCSCWRQPAGVQRHADDRARRPRPAEGDSRARRGVVVVDPRRSRTAEIADEHRGHQARHGRAAVVVRDGACAFAEGLETPHRARSRGRRRGAGAVRALHTRGGRSGDRHRPRRDPPAHARARRLPTAAVLRTHRHARPSPSARSPWLVDVLNASRATSIARGRDVPARGRRPADARHDGRARAGHHDRALAVAVRGLPEFFGELPVRRSPTRSRRRARARSARWSRWRATRWSRPPTRDAWTTRSPVPRLHGLGRHLRQRDHAPRQRDPSGSRCARVEKSHYDIALYMFASATSRTTRRR